MLHALLINFRVFKSTGRKQNKINCDGALDHTVKLFKINTEKQPFCGIDFFHVD